MEISNDTLSPKAQADLRLVNQAVAGDQKAYASLMGRYHDSIYYTLLRMVGNTTDAEDLTMETFGKAFQNIRQYTPDFAFSTWLFKVATNHAIDFLRKKKLERLSFEDSNNPEITVHHINLATPEDFLINKEHTQMLRSLVSTMKPRYRRLVELRYFNELSYEEISAETKIPIGTIKTQLYRARELLYNILKNKQI